ncbi:MAG: aldehyde dehydrogenase family protein [Rhodobacteraceae bacterium]|nr:aldehyde dehydrogenase family protein [Paracoccaceae bacterium]
MLERLNLQQSDIDALRARPIPAQHLWIDGRACAAADGATMPVASPIDGACLGHIPLAGEADVARATAAARRAFDSGVWSRSAPVFRKRVLLRLADLIEAEAPALTVLGVRDNGTEFAMALKAEAGSAVASLRYYAEAIDKTGGQIAPSDPARLALIHREPVGVVGAITPWNFPLMIGAWKIAPALAAGNTVVMKPPETASLSTLRLVELAHEAGLPPGVLNVVTGPGQITGRALALSMDVDVLVFTGAGGTGRKLLEYAAQSNLKRVYLELGGKSANVVFDDAPDLAVAAQAAAAAIFRNAGQVCVAGSRLLVQRKIADAFTEALTRAAEALRVGDPLDLSHDIGAVHGPERLASNLAMVDAARAEGARLITGGTALHQASGGSYMAPTVLADVAAHHRLFQTEVFGPVLAVTAFDTEAEAVALANDSALALAAGVWTGSLSRAHRMVQAVRAGVVHVNCYGGTDLTVPMGGQKQSGNGYDRSLLALEKFTNHKTAWIQL